MKEFFILIGILGGILYWLISGAILAHIVSSCDPLGERSKMKSTIYYILSYLSAPVTLPLFFVFGYLWLYIKKELP